MLLIKLDIELMIVFIMIVLALVTLTYIFFDVNYFIVTIAVIIWGKLYRKKIKPDESTKFYGICTTNDLDGYCSHMNNARYVRNLDFARLHFYDRIGLYQIVISSNATVLQTSSNIRYRRPIPLFAWYKIVTRMIYWDEKHIYTEHQFITINDGFIRAIVLSKQVIIGLNVSETISKLLDKGKDYRTVPPPELEDFISLNKKSSDRLRKKDDYKVEKCH